MPMLLCSDWIVVRCRRYSMSLCSLLMLVFLFGLRSAKLI